MKNDGVGLIASFGYAFGLLIIATVIQKARNYPSEFTRKIVHIGAGMWMIPTVLIFEHWFIGIIPTFTFIFLNYISYRFRLIKAMDLAGDTPGTVYFAISCTALLGIFWSQDKAWIALVGLMAMTWGDAFAALIGRRFGKVAYYVGSHRRTLEGSAAMFVFCFVPVTLVLLFAPVKLSVSLVLACAFLVSIIATFLEAISLRGTDNLLVPFGASFTMYALYEWNANISRILLGLAISSLIGGLAYQRKSLSFTGVIGAIITGTLIFGFGSWVMGLTLIAFFVYGTLLSKYKEPVKNRVAADKFDKGSRRDIGQALANGGLGAILAVLYFVYPDQIWLFAAFIGAMATVNADTWATELGVLSRSEPRLITSGKRVVPGTSGGITTTGTLAALAGGFAIGLTVWLLVIVRSLVQNTGNGLDWWWVVVAGALGGLAGTMFDSLLGATVQAMYTDPETGRETEKRLTRTGVKTRFSRGLPFMTNDLVNFLSSIFGAAVALLALLVRG